MAASAGQHSAKGTKKHSLMRSAKNKRTGKYVKQAARTALNKANRIKRQEALKSRPIGSISRNAQIKRDTRNRRKLIAKGELSLNRWGTRAGERQFGSAATDAHRRQHTEAEDRRLGIPERKEVQ